MIAPSDKCFSAVNSQSFCQELITKIVFLLQALIKKQQGNRIGFLMNYSVKKKRIIIYIRNNIPYNQAW